MDTRAYGTSGDYPRIVAGVANNGGEPATFPRTAPAGGAYVNANQFLDDILRDFPWSAWEPWRGLEIAWVAQYRRGNSTAGVSPPPLLSHRFTRRDVRVRLSASRPMPAGTKWTAHVRKAERWISGAEGIKWTTPVPGADPEVLTLAAGQRETVRTYIITQGSPDPGDPTDTSPSLEGRREIVLSANGTFVTPTQNDSDGDTIANDLEQKLGLTFTSRDSDDDGVRDSDQEVAGLDALAFTLAAHTKTLKYDENGAAAGGTVTANWGGTTVQAPGKAIFPQLHGKLAAPAWPQDGPTTDHSVPWGPLTAGGETSTKSSPSCTHITLAHQRLRGVLQPPPAAAAKRTMLLITGRRIGEETTKFTATAHTFTFTAGNSVSTNFVTVAPAFTSPAGPETITVMAQPVKIEVQRGNIPNASPKWMTQNGIIRDMVSLWDVDDSPQAPGREMDWLKVRVNLGGSKGDLPKGVTLPPDTIQWEIRGKTPPENNILSTEALRWPGEFGFQEVTITILGTVFKVFIHIPDVNNLSQADWVAQQSTAHIFGYSGAANARLYAALAENWANAQTHLSEPLRNALEHAAWIGMCAWDQHIGYNMAIKLGEAHEYGNKAGPISTPFETSIDLANNFAGASFASENLPGRTSLTLLDDITLLLKRGIMWVPDHPQNQFKGIRASRKSNGSPIFQTP